MLRLCLTGIESANDLVRTFALKCDIRLSESSLPTLVKLLMLVLLFPSANEEGIPGDLLSSLEESLCALPTLLRLLRLGPAPRCTASATVDAAGDNREGGEGDSASRLAWPSVAGYMRRAPSVLVLLPFCMQKLAICYAEKFQKIGSLRKGASGDLRLDLDSLLCLHEQPTKCEDPEARGLFCSQCRLFDLQSNSALIARTCKLHTRHVVRRNHRRGCCRLQPDGRDDQSLMSSSSCRAHSHSKPKHGSSKKERETERKPCCQCFVPTPHRENHQEFVFLRTHSVRHYYGGSLQNQEID